MNELDAEDDTLERQPSGTAVVSGLLPRDQCRSGARLEVVDRPERVCNTERLYRELPVRVDGTRTVLLAGTWCELQRGRSYRVRTVGAEDAVERLVTVEVVAESDVASDAERRRSRM